MNKILDNLGIYDLVGVLLSGIIICTFSLLVLHFVYKINIDIELQINETLTFLVLSYFFGLIFQECGSIIQKIIYKNNALLKKALAVSDDSYILLTETEKNSIYAYIESKLNLENDNIVYNYCKFNIMGNCDITRINKDQSLSAMSRSLSLYFTILAIFTLFTAPTTPYRLNVILFLLSFFFSILLYYRSVRFAKLRYIYIFRAFYYNVILK